MWIWDRVVSTIRQKKGRDMRDKPLSDLMEKNERLKPCPFCGGLADVGIISVGCNDEACSVRPLVTARKLSKAIEIWNRRDDPVRIGGVAVKYMGDHEGFEQLNEREILELQEYELQVRVSLKCLSLLFPGVTIETTVKHPRTGQNYIWISSVYGGKYERDTGKGARRIAEDGGEV